MDGDSDFEYGDEQYGDPNPTRVSQPGRAKLVVNHPHDEELALSDSGDTNPAASSYNLGGTLSQDDDLSSQLGQQVYSYRQIGGLHSRNAKYEGTTAVQRLSKLSGERGLCGRSISCCLPSASCYRHCGETWSRGDIF